MIKIIKFRKLKNKNKPIYEIVFNKNGKKIVRKFGTRRKKNYKTKNYKTRNIKIKDPTNSSVLNKFILLNNSSLTNGLRDYKRRLKIYNRTGKFPAKMKSKMKSKMKMKYGYKLTAREQLYMLGDRLGSRNIKKWGIDPDIRYYDELFEREVGPLESTTKKSKSKRGQLIMNRLKQIREGVYGLTTRSAKRLNLNRLSRTRPYSQDGIEMTNLFGYNVPNNVVNKKLYLSIKNKLKKSIKGRRWGAYDSGRLVKMYKSSGGKYIGSKGKTNLGRWYQEKWVDACAWPKRKSCGRKSKSSIAYCRPSKRIDSKTPTLIQSLSKAQIKSRCSRKKRNPRKKITY
jgi:hypothetical protein